jgi:hypothetical protein
MVNGPNYGLLNTNAPMQVASAVRSGAEQNRNNALQQMALEKAYREQDETNALKQIYERAGGDPAAVQQGLLRGGFINQANALANQQLSTRKAEAEVARTQALTGKTQAETQQQQMSLHDEMMVRGSRHILNQPDDQSAFVEAQKTIQYYVQQGIMPPQEAQQALANLNPQNAKEGAKRIGAMAMKSADSIPKVQWQDQGNQRVPTSQDPMTGQMRYGQAMPVYQSPDNSANQRTAMSAQYQRQAWRNQDMGARPNGAGTTPGLGYGKPPNEAQGKAATFGARAEEANRIIGSLDYSPAALATKMAAANTPIFGGLAGAAANSMLGKNEQMAEQAQRDFVNAVLRQESGAAIAESEFENAKKQYFPAVGDSKEVLAQKARNRELAVQGFKNQAGPYSFSAPPQQQQQQQQSTSPTPQNSGGVPSVRSVEEAMKLPPGTIFVDPNGRRRVR